jgi:hypothetical protein
VPNFVALVPDWLRTAGLVANALCGGSTAGCVRMAMDTTAEFDVLPSNRRRIARYAANPIADQLTRSNEDKAGIWSCHSPQKLAI